MITQDELRRLVSYDPTTGRFISAVDRHAVRAGQPLGGVAPHGYVQMCLNGKHYYAHRLAWLYVHGDMPKEIDHINRDRSDNRILNLRVVSRSENNMNRAEKPGRSGRPGVWKNKVGWAAFIRSGGKRRYLGNYPSIELASQAYEAAKKERDACEKQSPL